MVLYILELMRTAGTHTHIDTYIFTQLAVTHYTHAQIYIPYILYNVNLDLYIRAVTHKHNVFIHLYKHTHRCCQHTDLMFYTHTDGHAFTVWRIFSLCPTHTHTHWAFPLFTNRTQGFSNGGFQTGVQGTAEGWQCFRKVYRNSWPASYPTLGEQMNGFIAKISNNPF